jgi:hypothetical protein
MDPRVKTTPAGLREQFLIAQRIAAGMNEGYSALQKAKSAGDKPKEDALTKLMGDYAALYAVIEGADAAPTVQASASAAELERSLRKLLH